MHSLGSEVGVIGGDGVIGEIEVDSESTPTLAQAVKRANKIGTNLFTPDTLISKSIFNRARAHSRAALRIAGNLE
jgi:hypothetical protein